MKQTIKFCWSDVWLLAAIANVNQKHPAELKEIISEGDYLNHAIFTDEELENGLTMLITGGWIKKEGHKFLVTEKFLQKKFKIFTIGNLKKLEKLLGITN